MISLSLSLSRSFLAFRAAACSDLEFMDQVLSFPLNYHLPLRHFLVRCFSKNQHGT